jgi:plasmid maintenance system antidote protein VapI
MDIKTLIRQRGYRQHWVAEQIGLTEQDLSKIVTGRKICPDDKIEPLAKVLGVAKRDIEHTLAELGRSASRP